jgi:hypothetical protein
VVVERSEVGKAALRLFEVVAEDLRTLARTRAGLVLEPVCDVFVQAGAIALGQCFVGSVANQGMPEADAWSPANWLSWGEISS